MRAPLIGLALASFSLGASAQIDPEAIAFALSDPSRARVLRQHIQSLPPDEQVNLRQIVEKSISDLASVLPVQIDQNSWLVALVVVPGKAAMRYQTELLAEEIASRKDSILRQFCTSPSSGVYLLHSGSFSLSYYASDGTYLAELSVSTETCGF